MERTTMLFVVALLIAPVLESTSHSSRNWQRQRDQQKTDEKNEKVELFMQAKLSNAQKVLSGLVAEDYGAVLEGAERMKKIAEAAHWPTTIDEVYQHHSYEFRRQCDKLIRQAENRDMRAAHFVYLQLSTSCIDCHEYVRSKFKVEKSPTGPVRLIPSHIQRPLQKRLERPAPDVDDQDGTQNTKT